MPAICDHQQLLSLVEIVLPLGGSLKDVLVTAAQDDATTSTDSFSDSDSSAANSPLSHRCVRFDLDANIQYEASSLTCEDLDTAWCSRAEYKLFRRQTHAIAKQVADIEKQNIAAHSYERTVSRIYKACETALTDNVTEDSNWLSSADKRHLNRWAQAAPVRHGLDKWSLQKLSKIRSLQRIELQQTILDMQRRIIKDEYYYEHLRATSERMSRPSRLFVHCMAQSLANAEQSVMSMA
jgi:hypothetical protein